MMTLCDFVDTYCHDRTTILINNCGDFETTALVSDAAKIPESMRDLLVESWGLIIRPSDSICMEDIIIVVNVGEALPDPDCPF